MMIIGKLNIKKVMDFIVVITLVTALLVVVHMTFNLFFGENALENVEMETIKVERGETLWSIAESNDLYSEVELRELVHYIKNVNELETATINIGQELLVPVHK